VNGMGPVCVNQTIFRIEERCPRTGEQRVEHGETLTDSDKWHGANSLRSSRGVHENIAGANDQVCRATSILLRQLRWR